MLERLLWDRFLLHWLPPEKATGDVGVDIERAFNLTYETAEGKPVLFNWMGAAFAVMTGDRTVVVADVPPIGNLPPWIEAHAKKEARDLRSAMRARLAGNMTPHLWLEFRRTFHTATSPVLGGGTQIVVSHPDKTECIDLVRVDRARQAIEELGSKKRARDAVRLLDRRMATRDTSAIDTELRKLAQRSKLPLPAFFDAAEAAVGISNAEWELAT